VRIGSLVARVVLPPDLVVSAVAESDDGRDLVVTDRASDTVVVLRRTGSFGPYQVVQRLATGSDPVGVVLSDFNGDGVEDFAVVDRRSDATISWWPTAGRGA
jgi:hypothetical protein